MKAELIDCIAPGELCYTPFDCSVWQLGQPICLPPARLTIVEGAYSLHPYFGRYWGSGGVHHRPMWRPAWSGSPPGRDTTMWRCSVPAGSRWRSAIWPPAEWSRRPISSSIPEDKKNSPPALEQAAGCFWCCAVNFSGETYRKDWSISACCGTLKIKVDPLSRDDHLRRYRNGYSHFG